jgi:hypothetical protein
MSQQTAAPSVTTPSQVRKLSIVIPVYNEEATIHELVGLVAHADLPDGLTARDHRRQ